MKTIHSILLAGVVCGFCAFATGARALDAGLMPGETADAPSPAAEALWNTYTAALSSGDWSTALYCVDIERLRGSLLTRRLADLRAQNPGLSADDLERISEVLRARELDPARVRTIITDMWTKGDYAGVAWQLRGWREIRESAGSLWLARGQCTMPNGSERDYVVGMRDEGGDWQIDLDAVERLQAAAVAQTRGLRVPEEVPLPEAAGLVSEGYWTAWQAGDPAAAWAQLSPRCQQRRPLEEFTAGLATLTADMGVPVKWKLEHCRSLQPHLLGLGYEVVSAKGTFQALMILVEDAGGWSIEDVQVRRETPVAPAAAPAGERPFSTDLGQPSLRPDLRTPVAPATP